MLVKARERASVCVCVCVRVHRCCLFYAGSRYWTVRSSWSSGNTFLSELSPWDNPIFMEVVLKGNCENFSTSASGNMGLTLRYWDQDQPRILRKRWTDLQVPNCRDKVAISITQTLIHSFTLSIVRIKELFIFPLKKKTTSFALCPTVTSGILAEHIRSVCCYSPESLNGLVSPVHSYYWKRYSSMPAYGDSVAL